MDELLRRKKISDFQAKKYSLVGKRFGRLIVLSQFVKNKTRFAHCKCDCGKEFDTRCYHLKTGKTKSCGCLLEEWRNKNNRIYKKALYRIFKSMKDRCFNKSNKRFMNYGGRGISVCGEWSGSYANFEKWALKNGYKNGMSIERIDVNGNYCPENCKWIEFSEQANNKTNSFKIEYKGEIKTLRDWCKLFNLSYKGVWYRVKNGWGLEKAFSKKTPTGYCGTKKRRKYGKK